MSLFSEFESAIGSKSYRQVVETISWLYRVNDSDVEMSICRLAPSLITRSESEYLGLSSPRFAARVYVVLADEEIAFFNLRRLADLESAIRNRFGIADGAALPRDLRNAVADSLLSAPARLENDYHCLTSQMAEVYNESSPRRGTPYVSQLEWLGGGVCAECAAAISAQILFEYCDCVHGVAEVKSLAHSDSVDMLDSGGMTPEALVRYLRRQSPGPGLWGAVVTTERPATKAVGRDFRIESRDLSWALRCYVASGIPVILPCDLSRLNGRSLGVEDYSNTTKDDVLTKNGAPASIAKDGWPTIGASQTADEDALRVREHMVVVAGISKYGATSLRPATEERFIIHDSATLPFLEATGQDLFDVVSGDQRERVILPVVPAQAQVPLLPVESANSVRSIAEVANWLQRYDEDSPYFIESEHHFDIGTFRLVDLSKWSEHAQVDDLPANLFVGSNDFPRLIAQELLCKSVQIKNAAGGATCSPRFVWLQYQAALPHIGRCVHIWDAQLSEADNEYLFENFSRGLERSGERPDAAFADLQLRRFAIGRLCEGTDGTYAFEPYANFDAPTEIGFEDDLQLPGSKPLTDEEKGSIRLALINSFDPLGAFGINFWPALDVACEYYAFMEQSIARWRNAGVGIAAGISTAVQLLSSLSTDSSLRQLLATRVREEVSTELVSLASFFQEHAGAPGSPRSVVGVRALEGLFRFGCELRNQGSPVSTVEIVCGNRLGDVQVPVPLASIASAPSPLIRPSDITVVAPVRSQCVAIDYLLENLEQALKATQDELRSCGIRVVLELEPGTLFTNSSLSAIRRIVQRIEKSLLLREFLYLNLDCSHALLARISPDDLIRDHSLLKRFSHVHISGCDRRGHFGDTEQVSFFGFEGVVREMSRNMMRENRRLIISVEMEAARTTDTIVRTLIAARDALNSI